MDDQTSDILGEWLHQVLPSVPLRRHFADSFFLPGDVATFRSSTQILEPEDLELAPDSSQEFQCCIAGCKEVFSSVAKYEAHYASSHRHVCCVCRMVLPSVFLLDLHVQENHDSLFSVLAEKQPMYQCLVEACSEKFKSSDERRKHLIASHKYPKNFRFHTTSKSSKRGAKTQSSGDGSRVTSYASRDEEPRAADMEVADDVTSGATFGRRFAYKVPANISFGAGVSRGFSRDRGRGKHWHQQGGRRKGPRTNIEEMNLGDLASALDES